ncbi:hypothetical protein [Nostoc sp.]|nr:hypothetical protein [Nostoc sp.]
MKLQKICVMSRRDPMVNIAEKKDFSEIFLVSVFFVPSLPIFDQS